MALRVLRGCALDLSDLEAIQKLAKEFGNLLGLLPRRIVSCLRNHPQLGCRDVLAHQLGFVHSRSNRLRPR